MKKKLIYILLLSVLNATNADAQIDSNLLIRTPPDSVKPVLNMDAVYNRPFLGMGKSPISIGGYMEVNWQHLGTDGISEGHQFQFRRWTLFASATIARNLKFLTELEFEDGTKEIGIEFAALDMELHPLLNLRGGIILNPIGAFNQNHDGPKWEFTDRPFSATQLLPATWSNAGFGLYGKYYNKAWMYGYEVYVSNGFDGTIIQNAENKTFLPAAKNNRSRFEESSNGEPMITSKIAIRNQKIAEIGLSYMGGVYNKFIDDGLVLDRKRRCDVFAVDLNTTLPHINTTLTGEWAWIWLDVPATYTEQFGNRQQGGFLDLVQPVWKHKILEWNKAVINLACRLEYVDWNMGSFQSTGTQRGDELWSIMPAISFRPVPQTVIRLNYRFMKQNDIVSNPFVTTSGFIFGVSTYF
ncbi:MAG: hypothetical protein WC760_02055 [Bacteroidia bacterium]|jgi:hypothetical protein